MIRFQHAYQAAARVITTMDEMLEHVDQQTPASSVASGGLMRCA